MDLFGIVRRSALHNHFPISEICYRRKLSRKMFRKYLRDKLIESKLRTLAHPGMLAAFSDHLTRMHKVEAGKSLKQKRTLKQLHMNFLALGYTRAYGRVATFCLAGWLNNDASNMPADAGSLFTLD